MDNKEVDNSIFSVPFIDVNNSNVNNESTPNNSSVNNESIPNNSEIQLNEAKTQMKKPDLLRSTTTVIEPVNPSLDALSSDKVEKVEEETPVNLTEPIMHAQEEANNVVERQASVTYNNNQYNRNQNVNKSGSKFKLIIILGLLILVGVGAFKVVNTVLKTGKSIDENLIDVDENDSTQKSNYYAVGFNVFLGMNKSYPNVATNHPEFFTVKTPHTSVENGMISCSLNNRNDGWYNTPGYAFDADSSNCKEFMANAEGVITDDTYPFPDSGQVIFNGSKLVDGTKLVYGRDICEYNQQTSEFNCHKK